MARILVVDDDEPVRTTVGRVLDSIGHEATVCCDAGEALDRPDLPSYDLVITDLAMPTPGEVLIQHLRAEGLRTPVLLMSGYLDGRDRGELGALGVNRILEKPFVVGELLEALEELLDGGACGS